MKKIKTQIDGCYIFSLPKSKDLRGFFERLYCKKKISFNIKQINLSTNLKKGTLRGFHYQASPSKEHKIISCVSGSLFNVLIDMRKKSKTYKKIFRYNLTSLDNKFLYLPAGCANCFLTLENNTKILYYMEDYYKKNKNLGFNYKSKFAKINWPTKIKIISNQDKSLPFI